MLKQTIVISLGGSVIVPDEINIIFLKKFRKLVLDFVKKGGRAVIVTGGGGLNKKYNRAAQTVRKIKNIDLDWLGIAATKLNAELLRVIFGEQAYGKVMVNPNEKVKTKKKIIIASGWLPGCSTDKDAVLWAKNVGANVVINLTNVDYVYDKDPKKFKDAKPLKKLSWQEYKKLISSRWIPRLHSPFDPVAARLAEKWGIEVAVTRGTDLANFKNFLEDKEFKGTIIKNRTNFDFLLKNKIVDKIS